MAEFQGKRILIVEDEVLVSMHLEDMIESLGCEVVGPAATLKDGLEFARSHDLDCAIIDVNLNGNNSAQIADELQLRGLPFVLATGYGSSVSNVHDAPVLEKPYMLVDLESALRQSFAR